MTGRQRNLIELNAAVLLWSGTSLFAKWIPQPAFQISGLRSIVAALAILILLRSQRKSLRAKNRRDFWLLTATGLALTFHWVTYFQSIQVSTVAVGILSLHTYPVMTALAEPLVFKEKFHAIDLLIAGLVVIAILILVPTFSLQSGITQGVLWGVLSAVFFTLRNLLSRRIIQAYSGAQIMFYQFVTCSLLLLPVIGFWGKPLSGQAAWLLLVLGVIFTALPQTLFTNSLQHLTTKTVSIIATLLPLYGAIAAALLLGEIPSPRTLLGGAIILGAVCFETWRTVQQPNRKSDRHGNSEAD